MVQEVVCDAGSCFGIPSERRLSKTYPRRELLPPAAALDLDRRSVRGPWRQVLMRRRGWHAVRRAGRPATLVYLWPRWTKQGWITYCLDIDRCAFTTDQKHFHIEPARVPQALTPLAAFWRKVSDVADVLMYEVGAACATTKPLVIWAKQAVPVTSPVPRPKREAKARGHESGRATEESGAESNGSSEEALRCLSDDSVAREVATDLDEGVEVPGDAGAIRLVSSDSDSVAEHLQPRGAGGGGVRDLRLRKRRGGKAELRWENVWFKIQQNPMYFDIKVRLQKPVMNTETGMGTHKKTKALTPEHYGETPEHCPLTMFILRCWGVWRSRLDGWVDQTMGRQGILADELRELHALKDNVVRDGCFLPQNSRGGKIRKYTGRGFY